MISLQPFFGALGGMARRSLLPLWILLAVTRGLLSQNVPLDASCANRPTGCDLFCPFGFRWGFDRTCICVCYADPCQQKVCQFNQACTVRRSGDQFWGTCVRQIDQCLPGDRLALCYVNPCTMTVCSRNASLLCIPNFCGGCFAHYFDPDGREITRECRLHSGLIIDGSKSKQNEKPGECPDLQEGICLQECTLDTDCFAERKCCSNGCGHQCVAPAAAITDIRPPGSSPPASLFQNQPVGQLDQQEKIGQCPTALNVRDKSCRTQCASDIQCPGVNKCCDNGCARVCTAPDKATGCVHLAAAAERLPTRELGNGFVPKCSANGDFELVQCDRAFCWCTDRLTGTEAPGTKSPNNGQRPNCQTPRICPSVSCTNTCPYGYTSDANGCPTVRCECRNICEKVRCPNSFEACQLVEPDCLTPPCLPVPRCLVNPCPNGLPMTLPGNGVTALCSHSSQCTVNFWCHMVGYNGFGFCCPKPEAAIRPGTCPTTVPRSQPDECSATCKADPDCPLGAKCCFDGCGFDCVRTNGLIVDVPPSTEFPSPSTFLPTTANIGPATFIPLPNKIVPTTSSTKAGECPTDRLPPIGISACQSECKANSDCPGVKLCCSVGCSQTCTYPAKAPGCMHEAITAEVFGLPSGPSCDTLGRFNAVQCRDGFCYCVERDVGREIPGTRVAEGQTPNCFAPARTCPPLGCDKLCPFGFVLNRQGCPECQCVNPCRNVRCTRQFEVCMVVDVECSDRTQCSQQPRCVPNACPTGQPFASADRIIQQCGSGMGCSQGYWCHEIGLSGTGLCCPEPARRPRPGSCPATPVLLEGIETCELGCRTDEQCASGQRCCYDGCGTFCVPVSPSAGSITNHIMTVSTSIKSGQCPVAVSAPEDVVSSCQQLCQSDDDCKGNQKCCAVQCATVCATPDDSVFRPPSPLPSPTESTSNTFRPPLPLPPSTESTSNPFLPVTDEEKSGICPPPSVDQNNQLKCNADFASCQRDSDCKGLQKCCSDGCSTACVYPTKTTACLHLKAALEELGITQYKPRCRNLDGTFEQVQCDNTYCWCVTRNGLEVQGTRIAVQAALTPNCQAIKTCPPQNCGGGVQRKCEYDFELDSAGCPTCECMNPCRNIRCPHQFQVCVLEKVECSSVDFNNCPPVPRCVVNACPQGQPLVDPRTLSKVECDDDLQCHLSQSFCRRYHAGRGYCCPNPEMTAHPGACPRLVPGQRGACTAECRSDEQCSSNQKCCFNGCGMSCQSSELARPVVSLDSKIGDCPKVENTLSTSCSNRGIQVDGCQTDRSCTGAQKCCSDGCSKKCMYAQVTTACLHQQASAEAINSALQASGQSPNRMVVQCDNEGSFVKIQEFQGFRWCVDSKGIEIPGTRTSRGTPSCQTPRRCPGHSCTLRCPLGFKLDNDGCEQCICFDPCDGVRCQHSFQVCRLDRVQCFAAACAPVAKCVVNACPNRGEPLKNVDTWEMAMCDPNQGRNCPSGYFCHKIGQATPLGYCCPGNEETFSARGAPNCPAVPVIPLPSDGGLCELQCSTAQDCASQGACCFNGCGTSCLDAQGGTFGGSNSSGGFTGFVAGSRPPQQTVDKIGTCPVNPISNPGCRSDCTRDVECPGFQKCCPYGCGRLCQVPRIATACIHQNSALDELAKSSASLFVPQCDARGDFQSIQCSQPDRQCWCVDTKTGIEIIGTRTLSTNSRPDCDAPKFCAAQCRQQQCPFGLKLDGNGCPQNGQCSCKDPCQGVKCQLTTDICVAIEVTCVSQPCPTVPACKPDPCHGEQPVRDVRGQMIVCTGVFGNQCGEAECRLFSGETTKGICCPRRSTEQFSANYKIGECPARAPISVSSTKCASECTADASCPDVKKCCKFGCNQVCVSPINATNCIQYKSAIERLIMSNSASATLHKPICDDRSGLYASTQCDSEGQCWCVDTVTGIEVYGTRAFRSTVGASACLQRRQCAISCDSRSAVCSFGFETTSDGCPKDNNCRCKNPCDQVTCSIGQTCLLRPMTCQDNQACFPVPSCETNPCSSGQKPAVEPRTYTLFTCLQNRTQICPSSFYCTGYNQDNEGVCCAEAADPFTIIDGNHVASSDLATCSHGDPFSNAPDGAPLKCSLSTNTCPSTHYCFSKPGDTEGICCVTKRFVCNLPQDSGPCTVIVPRFYFNIDRQSCLPFNYGGCSGNLNNFASETDCDKFCVGTGVDFNSPVNEAVVEENGVQMGFSLSGPLLRDKHQPSVISAFRTYLTKNFGVRDEEIEDLSIKDDNTVRFAIRGADAVQQSKIISEAVSQGRLQFVYDGDTYRAEPQTWFSEQISHQVDGAGAAFWGLIISCVIFGIVIVIALCAAATFMYRKGKRRSISYRGSTPTTVRNYPTNTAYMASQSSHSPNSDNSAPTRPMLDESGTFNGKSIPRKVFSTDDINQIRGTDGNGGYYSQAQYVWQDQQNPVNVRNKTMLYY